MLKVDIPIWYRFVEKYGSAFISIYLDVLLGAPHLTPAERKDPFKRDWQALLAKRADAIVELEDQVWIVEVAAEPGLRALGQVMVYRALWLRDPRILKIEKMVLVCDRIDPLLLDACGIHGVLVFII